MDHTASLLSSDHARGATRSWYLVLALEATRPFAGALRLGLHGMTEVSVGRGPARAVTRDRATLRLDLDDRFQSKDHVRLRRDAEGWQLEDAGSKNGTRWRGRRTARATLADGDLIEVGTCFLIVREAPGEVTDEALVPEPGEALRTLHAALATELALVARLAPSRLPILLRGESGTGKEIAARAIHAMSGRRGALIAVNCGALPAALAEAELFGARRGAFSGAVDDRPGLVRAAEGGTLFLDEIADLPLSAQAALLRFVQEGELRPLGSHVTARVDVRVVAATHRDLDALVVSEAFRVDLAARLRGHELAMPALRERREDLGLLCGELLLRASAAPRGIERAAARALFAYPWPGNVRELEHALRYAMAHGSDELGLEDLPGVVRGALDELGDIDAPSAAEQRVAIVALLAEHGGNLSAVARALQTSRSQLKRLLRRHEIER